MVIQWEQKIKEINLTLKLRAKKGYIACDKDVIFHKSKLNEIHRRMEHETTTQEILQEETQEFNLLQKTLSVLEEL